MRIYVVNHSCTHDCDGTRFEANVEFWPEHTNDIFEYEKLIRDCSRGAFEVDRFRKLFNIKPRESTLPAIKNVYFNDPVTVVLWDDGTKTIVRCQKGDTYSKETGLSLCIAKKAMGNKSNFNDIFKKWIPEEEKPVRGLRSKLNLDEWDKMENTSDKLYRCAKEACAPKGEYRGCSNCRHKSDGYELHANPGPCKGCTSLYYNDPKHTWYGNSHWEPREQEEKKAIDKGEFCSCHNCVYDDEPSLACMYCIDKSHWKLKE